MGENMYTFDYIENFIKPPMLSGLASDEPILLGFSGGADSSLLFYMLLLYRKETNSPIYAAHIEHGIRGEEALRDLEFCRSVCKENNVEFFHLSVDIPTLAMQEKKSVEHCARETRYSFFEKIMAQNNIKILATAHNADDNTETLIFNIMRGSGIHGACGIPFIRKFANGIIIRPLIGIEKAKIIEFCENNNIKYVTDSTNEHTDYSRNFIRANIIPLMKKSNPQLNDNIARFCNIMRKNASFLSEQAKDFIYENVKNGDISIKQLQGLNEALLAEIILQMYNNFCNETLEFVHVEAIINQINSQKSHFTLNLPHRVFAFCQNNILSFEYLCNKIDKEDYNIKVTNFSGVYYIDNFAVGFCKNDNFLSENNSIDKNIYKLVTANYINFDNIRSDLFLRNRRAGDTILLNSMHKKIKKLFCDYKIPINMRDRLPLLCCGDEIVCIPYIGVADNYRCDKKENNSCIRLYILKQNESLS